VLCNLENIARIPKRFIEIETITLEGIKKNWLFYCS
jgi:hypothetical protein